jgi:hypothetical protein
MEPLEYNAEEPQYPQSLSWSCSACSLAWLNRALGIQHATDELGAVNYIGEPDNINSTYGLMDGSGTRLVQCLREQGAPALNGWWTWDQTYTMAGYMPLLIGGVGWNHWVGVRGSVGVNLDLANSAEGWQGITNLLSEGNWNELGPFAVVAVPLLRSFPPPTT